MKKFTIGDLVTLSAAGRKNKHNDQVYGHIGIVTEIRFPSDHPYQIKWIGVDTSRGHGLLPMAEYEIKFAKNGVVSCE